jgi:hypothetical protein
MQVAEAAFLEVEDLQKVGVAGAEGIALLTACKTALTNQVLLPYLRSISSPAQDNRG